VNAMTAFTQTERRTEAAFWKQPVESIHFMQKHELFGVLLNYST